MKRFALAFALVAALACDRAAAQPSRQNLALGKPYTMTKPDYPLCRDPDDKTQLTDGVRSKGYFWMQKPTVGWTRSSHKYITIDLGEVHPISGVVIGSAGGVADVRWPEALLVYVSDDAKQWYPAGDLVNMPGTPGAPPAYGKYANHVFRKDDLQTFGRYVKIIVEPGGQYFFADEIEVYAGDESLLGKPRGASAVTDIKQLMKLSAFNRLIKQQLSRDLAAARADVAEPRFPDGRRAEFDEAVRKLAERIDKMPKEQPEGFRAVLPMNELERDIFRFQASVWRARRDPPLRLWQKHRWDPLGPSEEPQPDAPRPTLSVAMMTNEYRADVLNITNATSEDQAFRLRIEGLPGGTNPEWVKVHEVLCVGTRRFVAVSAALPLARRDEGDWVVTVPSGMTRQLWLGFCSKGIAPGAYDGRLVLDNAASGNRAVPIRVRVYPLQFPDSPTLNLGAWSYTNAIDGRRITHENREALVRHLKEHYVNAPWATRAIVPFGEYDAEGNLTKEPDTAAFDAFVQLWPGARHYMVYVAMGDYGRVNESFLGAKLGTPLFEAKVANWIRFWAGHMRTMGLKPAQLGLLIVDEPHDKKWYDAIVAYAKVINRVEPEVTLWVDPQVQDDKTCVQMLSSMDVLVPHRPQWLTAKGWFQALFESQRRAGRQLGFYSAHGPARTFDPFSYYLVQHWHCFKIGGVWSGFWSFGGDGRFSVWNEYATDGTGSYCPMYLDPEGVTAAKYMEAVREGVQDYEYLVMLRDRIAALEKRGAAAGDLAPAKALLAGACDRVLAGEKGQNYRWDVDKDRGVADAVRVEVLDALAALRGGN